MLIKPREKETETLSDEEKEEIDQVENKLELIKYTSQVQSRIRDEITSDFILAKLGDKDKEAVIEMTSNAYFAKKIIWMICKRAKARGVYVWDKKQDKYVREEFERKKLEVLKGYGKVIFDSYMNRVYMTVLLNRNVPQNYLIRLMAGLPDEEKEEEEESAGMKGIKAKIGEIFKNKENETKE